MEWIEFGDQLINLNFVRKIRTYELKNRFHVIFYSGENYSDNRTTISIEEGHAFIEALKNKLNITIEVSKKLC